jgi:hypothetical protein
MDLESVLFQKALKDLKKKDFLLLNFYFWVLNRPQ